MGSQPEQSELPLLFRIHLHRRNAVAAVLGTVGIALLGRAGSLNRGWSAVAHDDDDHDSGRGRGRGRGRGGRDDGSGHDNGHDDDNDLDADIPLGEVPDGSIEIRIISDDAGGFRPEDVTVDAGQPITFVNGHDDEHTASGSGFDTGIIEPGSMETVTMETPGRFAYACQIHPEMTGTVSVRDADGNVPLLQATPVADDATTITIANLAFAPATQTVHADATVVWTNDDAVPHTVTSVDGLFDSGIFDPGASFIQTFSEPGSFDYACQLHPEMRGTIVVEGNSLSGPTP